MKATWQKSGRSKMKVHLSIAHKNLEENYMELLALDK